MHDLIQELWQRWQPAHWLWNLTLLAAALAIGLLVAALLWATARWQRSDAGSFFLVRSLVRHLGTPVNVFLPLFILDLLLPEMRLTRSLRGNIAHAVEIGEILAFAWILIRLLRVLQDVTHARINLRQSDNLRQRRIFTQLLYIRRVAGSIIVLLAIGAVLLTFSTLRKLGTGLLTGVGIGGIIVGFAAQRSLANLLAGFQIAFTQPVRIDDEVVVEGHFGRIEEITLTYVVVRIWDERRLVLPITYFLEKPFENWTRTTAQLMGTVFFYTDHTVPVAAVRTEFLRIVHDSPLWDGRTAGLIVSDVKADALELRGLVSAANSSALYDLRCIAREAIMKFLADHYPDSLPRQRVDLPGKPGATGDTPASA
ncbi:mechanosensitive ion channel family protein [Flaviaesturariibacter amylovorans]|uniref:Mechanosensitive ion channel n=1 Tax=Flaviaesturariibacter amylovorans TaxID=1084520 RepID=A0ABP8GHY8_9BACT